MPATLLFLPGMLCDGRLWEAQHRALAISRPCVLADYRYDASIVAMAATALDQAPGQVIPIGLSMGGIVALEIWRQAPERVVAMALFDTNPGPDTSERCAMRETQSRAATAHGMRAMVASQLVPTYFSSAQTADTSLSECVIAMAIDQGLMGYAAQSAALATRQDAWPLLEHITVPTLVSCGTDDQICPLELHRRMVALLPNATLQAIANAGHIAPLEQPLATTCVLQTWLKSIEAIVAK